MAVPEILCPAGEAVHPVLSPHPVDVQCRVNGHLQPAVGSGGIQAICCGDYTKCRIWQVHKEIECGPSTKSQRDQQRSADLSHTLSV